MLPPELTPVSVGMWPTRCWVSPTVSCALQAADMSFWGFLPKLGWTSVESNRGPVVIRLKRANTRNEHRGSVEQPRSAWQVGESLLTRMASACTAFTGSARLVSLGLPPAQLAPGLQLDTMWKRKMNLV